MMCWIKNGHVRLQYICLCYDQILIYSLLIFRIYHNLDLFALLRTKEKFSFEKLVLLPVFKEFFRFLHEIFVYYAILFIIQTLINSGN